MTTAGEVRCSKLMRVGQRAKRTMETYLVVAMGRQRGSILCSRQKKEEFWQTRRSKWVSLGVETKQGTKRDGGFGC